MTSQIFIMVCLFLVIGCNKEEDIRPVHSEEHKEETTDLSYEGGADLGGMPQEEITITDVVLRESEGGYYTDNRFICNVRSRIDCELWLEVCDFKDGHQFSEIKDESWTRREVSVRTDGLPSTYSVNIVIDGAGERVKSVVKLWGKPLCGGDATILFKTNAVFGTWKGR